MSVASPIAIIENKILPNYDAGEFFLPHTKLKKLDRPTVEAILLYNRPQLQESCQSRQLDLSSFVSTLAAFVVDDVHAIFATLAGMKKPFLIEQFWANNVRQDVLPVSSCRGEDPDKLEVRSKKEGELAVALRSTFSQPPWDSVDIRTFCRDQWAYMSPVFDQHVKFEYEFEPEVVLPYTTPDTTVVVKSGAYATVEKKSIHVDHIKLLPGQVGGARDKQGNHCVALKTMLQSRWVDADARREAEALEIIRKEVKSDHVIRAIAYFRQKHSNKRTVDHCFILPWAQRGNLRDFWIDGPTRPNTDPDWVLRQLWGLTEAIAEMHGLKGDRNLRHGDLKPENILCFQDDPQSEIRLVITDVGLAKTHGKTTDKRIEMQEFTSTKVSTTRYEAPELKAQDDNARVLPRAFDVWAIGCIGMEFVIWLLYGLNELVRFTDETKEFWETLGGQEHRVADLRVHRRVDAWLSYMASEDGRCGADTALGKMIKLIKDDLIVVKVSSLAHEGGGAGPAPAQPKSSKGKWSRLFERTVSVPVCRGPYRSSSAEAAKRLREITDDQAARKAGPGSPGKTKGPPPPGPTGKKNSKKKR